MMAPKTTPPHGGASPPGEPRRLCGHDNARPRRIFVAAWSARRLLDGIEAFAKERGLVWDVEALALHQTGTIRLAMEAEKPDGAIIGFDSQEVKETLRRTSMPVVFLNFGDVGAADRPSARAEPAPRRERRRLTTLDLDFSPLGRAAAHHYLEIGGYRAFGFIEATRDPRWSRERGDAFRDAVARRGLPFHRFSAAEGIYQAAVANRRELAALAAWLRAIPKPCALFAATDERARETILACREAGLAVPRQVAVMGVNDDEFLCRHVFPNLTSVAIDDAAVGRAAAAALQRLFAGGRAGRAALPVEALSVAARASTAPSSPGGPLVRQALDWIDAHACEGATAADVSKALRVSSSLLDLRFRELHHVSVHGAILERRLCEVCRRLRETDEKIEAICEKAGFGDAAGLRRLFRRRHGCSMREWRRKPASVP